MTHPPMLGLVVALGTVGLVSVPVRAAVTVDVVVGSDLGPLLPSRLLYHLGRTDAVVKLRGDGTCGGESDLCMSFGASKASSSVISASALSEAGPEGFVLYDGPLPPTAGGVTATRRFLAVQGNAGTAPRVDDPSAAYGSAAGAFRLLERVGFAFVHAFQPVAPASLAFAASFAPPAAAVPDAPRWPVRSLHYHTEHPLDLTDFLQGFDASCAGVNASSASGCGYHESWESMRPGFLAMADWLLASGQNRLEWIPLYNGDWAANATSPVRLARLRNMTATLHALGLLAVIDVPVAERQQNAWYMTSAQGSAEQNQAEIAAAVDRWAGLGFDALATESGFSEFTHPACDVMLALLNFTAQYASDAHGMPVYVKAHCSTGQTCPDYPDPRTGAPINFNFLPALGSPLLNVMPHTVQVYSEGDPTSNSYGNNNLTYMFDFATWLAARSDAEGQGREVVWHGESAYWVNYDIDIAAALGPLYGERRVNDLRVLAAAEKAAGFRSLRGSNVFASGSAWGYWVGNTLACRAAWSPGPDGASQAEAFAAALEPVAAALFFGSAQGRGPAERFKAVMATVAAEQRRLLVLGNATGAPRPPPGPAGTTLRNGMAYLAGVDTWSTVETLVEGHTTQPNRVPLTAVANTSTATAPGYADVLRPLLEAQAAMVESHLAAVASLAPSVRPEAAVIFADLVAAFNATAARTQQVRAVYASVAPGASNASRAAALAAARDSIVRYVAVAKANEARYGTTPDRVASWRGSPTSYTYGFLWTVRSGFYLWRDYGIGLALADLAGGKSLDIRRLSPCYQNIDDPIAVGIGDDTLEALAEWARREAERTGGDWVDAIADCLAAPTSEPVFPAGL